MRQHALQLFLAASFFLFTASLAAQTPPAQPAKGPGGQDYPHASVRVTGPFYAAGHEGEGAYRYWLFEPASPAPARAPVVLFLHAFLAYQPSHYQFWIAHMARKGYTVVWAQYDDSLIATWTWANNAADAFIDALKRLDASGRVRPAKDNLGRYQTAVVGHSAGGYMAPVLAAKATRFWWNKLPRPKLLVAIEPGNKNLIPGEDWSRIDPSTKVLIVSGDDDSVVCLDSVPNIWSGLTHIPDANKDFLLVLSDKRGQPEQIANHYFPNNSGFSDTALVDGRDYYVTFRLSVAALNCTFKGLDCEIGFGNGDPRQLDMGQWSDGAFVKQMLWFADPAVAAPSCRVP